jgi:hypothetical protein
MRLIMSGNTGILVHARSLVKSVAVLATMKHVHGVVDHLYYRGLEHVVDTTYSFVTKENYWDEVTSLPYMLWEEAKDTITIEHYVNELQDLQDVMIGAAIWLPLHYLQLHQLKAVFLVPSLPVEAPMDVISESLMSWLPNDAIGRVAEKVWNGYDVVHTLGHCWEIYAYVVGKYMAADHIITIHDQA